MTDCDAGGCILRQGKLGRSMYFVRSGFVDLVMDGAVVDSIAAGDYFGEVALLSLPPTHELLKVVLLPPPPPPPPGYMQMCLLIALLPSLTNASKVSAGKQKHSARLAASSL